MSPTRGTGSWSGQRRSFPTKTRQAILQRDGYVCQLRYEGCTTVATEADHITPHAEGGSDDESNGQAVCSSCHDVKTKQEAARGKARRPQRIRPQQPHPGLLQPPEAPGG